MEAAHFLSESEWRDLLREIHNHQVIPIVGPELITLAVTSGEPALPLHRALAPPLAKSLGFQNPFPPDSINRVACQYLLRGGQRKKIYMEVSEMLANLERQKVPPPAALRDLASITDFDFFIAGTIDHFLAAALEESRSGFHRGTNVLAFDYRRPIDIPERIGPTLMYHLLGHRPTYPNFAVWEEDYLEFLCGLIQHQSQLPNLFRMLKSRFLLFLGTPFSDWVVRFFLFVAKGGRFSDHRKDEVVAYLTDLRENLGEPLIFFFDQVVGTAKVIPGDPAGFTTELARRWREEQSKQDSDDELFAAMPPECPRGAVFISYSHQDRTIVGKLVRSLRSAQVPVWVDRERLQAGENYQRSLEVSIKSQCSFFLSVISKATESDATRYVHRERHWASECHVEGYIFYVPVIIDDTPLPTREPQRFAHIHCERISGGAPTPAFVNRLCRLLEDYRVAGRPRA